MKQANTAWNAFAVDPGQVVHARPMMLKDADGEGQRPVDPLSPDPALEQLLGAGVAPALALHRAQHERRGVFPKQGDGSPAAVHLASGKVHQPATPARAQFDQGKQSRKFARITSCGTVLYSDGLHSAVIDTTTAQP